MPAAAPATFAFDVFRTAHESCRHSDGVPGAVTAGGSVPNPLAIRLAFWEALIHGVLANAGAAPCLCAAVGGGWG